MFRVIATSFLSALLAACAGGGSAPDRMPAVPLLRLSPAALAEPLALVQRLTVSSGSKVETLDALLEADGHEVRLHVQALGRSALQMTWDGTQLRDERADWLPAQLSSANVLSDLQWIFWPADSIRTALGPGWSLVEAGQGRHLLYAGVEQLTVTQLAPGRVELRRSDAGYSLLIESTPAQFPP